MAFRPSMNPRSVAIRYVHRVMPLFRTGDIRSSWVDRHRVHRHVPGRRGHPCPSRSPIETLSVSNNLDSHRIIGWSWIDVPMGARPAGPGREPDAMRRWTGASCAGFGPLPDAGQRHPVFRQWGMGQAAPCDDCPVIKDNYWWHVNEGHHGTSGWRRRLRVHGGGDFPNAGAGARWMPCTPVKKVHSGAAPAARNPGACVSWPQADHGLPAAARPRATGCVCREVSA